VSWDRNPYDSVYQSPTFIIYRILLPLMFCLTSSLAGYKIILWISQMKQFKLSIGLVCLCLELVANLIRIISGVVYPSYNCYLIFGVETFISLPVMLTILVAILVIFFWFDVTLDPFFHKQGKCLGILRIPAIVIVTSFIVMEICETVIRDVIQTDIWLYIMAIYLAAHILISIFYFIAAYKILNIAKTSIEERKLIFITKRICLSGGAVLCLAVALLLIYTPATSKPVSYAIVWFIIHMCFFCQSLSLISIFTPPKSKKVSSSSGSKAELASSDRNPVTVTV